MHQWLEKECDSGKSQLPSLGIVVCAHEARSILIRNWPATEFLEGSADIPNKPSIDSSCIGQSSDRSIGFSSDGLQKQLPIEVSETLDDDQVIREVEGVSI
jgi:hypothetical protein